MKFLMFLLFFLFVGAFFIISNENLNLRENGNMGVFVGLYGNWLEGLVENSKVVSGYIVKMQWLPNQGEED
jgi:hypothetical protein